MRHTLGLKLFVSRKLKLNPNYLDLIWTDFSKTPDASVTQGKFYYALDGLFDFVNQGQNHYGVSVGFSTDLFGINAGRAFGIVF